MGPLLALALAVQPATPETLTQLERTYEQACLGRLYGQLDDVCSDMEGRLKAYRRELRRQGRGNAAAPSPAKPATPQRSPPMPDQASTPNPLPPTDAKDAAPSSTGPNSSDSLARAFEAVRDTGARDNDHAEIAADDAGATSAAEEMGAPSQKP